MYSKAVDVLDRKQHLVSKATGTFTVKNRIRIIAFPISMWLLVLRTVS